VSLRCSSGQGIKSLVEVVTLPRLNMIGGFVYHCEYHFVLGAEELTVKGSGLHVRENDVGN
jgi:hypothetical protein